MDGPSLARTPPRAAPGSGAGPRFWRGGQDHAAAPGIGQGRDGNFIWSPGLTRINMLSTGACSRKRKAETIMRRWILATGVGAALAAAVPGGCSRGGGAEAGGAARRAAAPIPVAVSAALPRDLARTVTVTGPIEPIRAVSVNAQTAGTVESVLVEEGDRVRSGQLLAETRRARDGRAAGARRGGARQRREPPSAGPSSCRPTPWSPKRNSTPCVRPSASPRPTSNCGARAWPSAASPPRCPAWSPPSAWSGAAPSRRTPTMFAIADDALLVVRVRVSELDVVHLQPGRAADRAARCLSAARSSPATSGASSPAPTPASRLVPVEVVLDPVPRRRRGPARIPGARRVRAGQPAAACWPSRRRPSASPKAARSCTWSQADTLSRRPVETGLTAAGWIEVTARARRRANGGQLRPREPAPGRRAVTASPGARRAMSGAGARPASSLRSGARSACWPPRRWSWCVGLFFAGQLPLDLLPQIIYPQIRVRVTYPGVAPEVMEEQVTKILETSLATTEDLIELESETSEGDCDIDLHFNYGTDINFALQDASKNLDRARSRLPVDADPPVIRKFDPSQIPVFEVGFSSPTRDLVDLRNWVDLRLQPQLLTDRGRGGRGRGRRPGPRDPGDAGPGAPALLRAHRLRRPRRASGPRTRTSRSATSPRPASRSWARPRASSAAWTTSGSVLLTVPGTRAADPALRDRRRSPTPTRSSGCGRGWTACRR